ncbi:MAG: P-loop NTPase [Euryarchaeota archaeon]|nr:P-loop NTPase [Euryarchaeota archaeon]
MASPIDPTAGPHPVMPGEEDRISENTRGIKHIVVVMSGKGGVGKSTITAHLAMGLTLKGMRVGVIDADFHGPSIPKMLGAERERLEYAETPRGPQILPVFIPPQLKIVSISYMTQGQDTPVVWRGPIKMKAVRQFLEDVAWGELDYLLFDLPPGTGDEPLSIAQVVPRADGVVIVSTPQDVATAAVRKSIKFAELLHLPVLGVVENMSGYQCPHCGKPVDLFDPGGGERMAREFNVEFLGKIPLYREIADAGDRGKPVVLTGGPAAKYFERIVENLHRIVSRRASPAPSRAAAGPPPAPPPEAPQPPYTGPPVPREKVAQVLVALQPVLKSRGAGLELVGIEGGVVAVRLDGGSSTAERVALLQGIEKTLRQQVPEVQSVVAIS